MLMMASASSIAIIQRRKTGTARLQREVIELKELAQYEELEEGMPEVY